MTMICLLRSTSFDQMYKRWYNVITVISVDGAVAAVGINVKVRSSNPVPTKVRRGQIRRQGGYDKG